MLTLKDKLLLFLDLLSDQEIFCPRRFIAQSFSSYKYSAVDQRLRDLARKGMVASSGRGNSGLIKLKVPLTEFWKSEVFDRRRFGEGWQWDGLWRIVLFDIAEEQRKVRDSIRRKLKSLGFAMFQKSVWITPFDVAPQMSSFLKKIGLKGPVEILEGKRLFVENEKTLADKLWDLKTVNQSYKRLAEGELFSFEDFLKVKLSDPCLPKELLIRPWYATAAEARLKKFIGTELI